MSSLFFRAFAVCLLVSVAAAVRAEPPAGNYAIPVGGSASIWQPGGTWDFCETEQDVELCFVITESTDVAGVVTGTGTFTFTGLVEGELVSPVTGQMSGSTEKSKVSLSGPLEGQLSQGAVVLDINGSVSFKCKEDPLDPALFDCKPKVKLCAYNGGKKVGCDRIGGKSGEANVAAIGGPWVLRLAALATDSAGNVTGDAEVELATGQILAFTASGKYNAKSDSSKLTLLGAGPATSSRIKLSKLVLSGGGASAGKISFAIAGQKGKAEIAPVN